MYRNAKGLARSVSGLAALAGLAAAFQAMIPGGASPANAADGGGGLETRVLTGLVRDFRELSELGGHPDMQRFPCRGYGHYVNIVDDDLDSDGKPTFRSSGCLVSAQSTDAEGRNIIGPRDYIDAYAGDMLGAWDCFGDHESDDGEFRSTADVSGRINLNPNNNSEHEFSLRCSDGRTITRDDLHANFEGYDGPAEYAFFRPKGNGNQNGLMLDGVAYELRNGAQYEVSSPGMQVLVYNDKIVKGRAMGHWWLEVVEAQNASFWSSRSDDDEDHSYAHSIDFENDGSVHVCNSGYPGGGAVFSPTSLASWFRDIPSLNLAKPVSITLVRDPDSGAYVFDDRQDAEYARKGGFFPVDNALFGNSLASDHNHHFTYEIQAAFVHRAGEGHSFTFEGDDDAWVFIDGRLVIDLGGIRGPVRQTINLDRLSWLTDGQPYELSFYYAERHNDDSHFRIESTLDLQSIEPPVASALSD